MKNEIFAKHKTERAHELAAKDTIQTSPKMRRRWSAFFVCAALVLVMLCAQAVAPFAIAESRVGTLWTRLGRIDLPVEEKESLDEDAAEAAKSVGTSDLIGAVMADLGNFDLANDNPLVVWMAHYFSAYLGQIVVFGDWENGRSGSFGPVIGLHENNKGNAEVLKHEHGHYEQYKQIGLVKYLFAIALLSLTHDPAENYYSQPWEVTADMLGGVTKHAHVAGAEEAGKRYLARVKETDTWVVVLGSIIVNWILD